MTTKDDELVEAMARGIRDRKARDAFTDKDIALAALAIARPAIEREVLNRAAEEMRRQFLANGDDIADAINELIKTEPATKATQSQPPEQP